MRRDAPSVGITTGPTRGAETFVVGSPPLSLPKDAVVVRRLHIKADHVAVFRHINTLLKYVTSRIACDWRVRQWEKVQKVLHASFDSLGRNNVIHDVGNARGVWGIRQRNKIYRPRGCVASGNGLGKVSYPLERSGHCYRYRISGRDGVRLFQRDKKESLVTYEGSITLTKSWQRQRSAKIEARNLVTIKRLCQLLLINEERRTIKRLVAHEIIDAAGVVPAATLGHDRNHRAAVVAVFGCVVVAQHLDFAHRILIDRHADLI